MGATSGDSGNGFDAVKLMRAQVRQENAATVEGALEDWLIGKDATDDKVLDALWVRGITLRIAKRHGCWDFAVTSEFKMSRLNVNVDDANRIIEVLGRG